MAVTQTIRDAINATDETLYRVAKETNISWATLKRFVDGGGLRSEHIDTLAAYFGLELAPIAPKPAKPTKKAGKK